jgi:hypothetical protein
MSHYGVAELLKYGGFVVKNIYGGQNFLSTLFRLTYPLGPNKISMKIYDLIFNLTVNIKGLIWAILKRKNPNQKLKRFDSKFSFSFKEWLRITNAGCIIFKAIKEPSK